MRIVLHPEASAEVRGAALWYDERRAGLGEQFLAEVGAVLNRIQLAPHSFPRWPEVSGTVEPVRKAVMQRFPYVIAFELHAGHILVLAVAHAKRRPLYWFGRTTAGGD